MERSSLSTVTLCFLFHCCFHTVTETRATHQPRMIFTDKEAAVRRVPVPGGQAPVRILLEAKQNVITVVGKTHLYLYNFHYPQKSPAVRSVSWKDCTDRPSQTDCSYNITVIHTREAKEAFVCGTNGKETLCCDMSLSSPLPTCSTSTQTESIKRSIRSFAINEGESSALVESPDTADLYITRSGVLPHTGIYKFGKKRVGPAEHNREQHYVGLMVSRRDDPTQDRVYAFYKEKNRDSDLQSPMWVPFVTQVCMADIGGPKNKLQLSWTSQLNAKLFCGDPDSGQHFSELVDVAIVQANQWQDTRVYGLFRNEWDMSAVCVYLLRDVDHIFTTSPFKGSSAANPLDRSRTCVTDSTRISFEALNRIEKTSEMELWVRPVNKSVPLIVNRHNYTHIRLDSSEHERSTHRTVLFLSLNNGGIHKLVHSENHTFLIAEYRPFNHHAHILSITFQPSPKKLYINTGSELVQLDVQNCAKYGESIDDCDLARDPYCSWNGSQCVPETRSMSKSEASRSDTHDQYQTEVKKVPIMLPPASKYFLRCPISSHHAQYTWHHNNSTTSCMSKERECLLLIDSMSPAQVGTYTCVSEEMGYRKELVHYFLHLRGRAESPSSSPLIWVCLMAVMTARLSC